MGRYYKPSIPSSLADELRTLINEHPEFGYSGPSEAVKDAVRRLIRDLEARAARPDETGRDPGGQPADADRRRQEVAREFLDLLDEMIQRRDAPDRGGP